MKRISLTRRLIVTVLLLECALAAGMSAATLLYTWREQMHGFDQMVRGRADSLLGAVHDAEDPGDNVAINPAALDLHKGDLWMARDARGPELAHSAVWIVGVDAAFTDNDKPHGVRIAGRPFRGLVLHGVRQIDANDTNPGIARPVTIYYAASLHPVYEAVTSAAQFMLLASIVLLALTGFALAFLLRRGLAPLGSLSLAAAQITPRNPRFVAPDSAHQTTELAVLAAALESATQRLEEAFRQQQVFVHDAAHELKTAVTIVKSSLQLLASRPRTAREYSSGLETCLADCARMEELVQRMLQLARFERGAPARNDRCDLAEVARDVTAQMERLAEIRRVTLTVVAPASAPVPLAEDACASLLANLMLNAVQHTPPGGSVATTVASESIVSVAIEDTGAGIAPEDLPHLFERFWRGDASRTRTTGGAGLGLSICKAIVDACGGHIAVASRLGSGTCVTVRLPLAAPASEAAQPSAVSEPAIH
ncbi:MAG TPA: HAMP domain-containing sensor histidine kinase [Acidobacteriaceae bacterium]|jgi:signal transduction histidine kinase|nr:HAMP domain-containing sensor histidine kinase [Acidobacteriaceae bacterium]